MRSREDHLRDRHVCALQPIEAVACLIDMDHGRYSSAHRSRTILSLLCIFLVTACEEERDITFSNTIDAPTFTIQTPAGWTFTRQQGYDSYIGEISGPFGTLHFDQGYFAQKPLHQIRESERTIFVQRMLVNGDSAILYKERPLQAEGKTILAMHIQERGGVRSNHLYVIGPNPLNERIMTGVMMTHRFK